MPGFDGRGPKGLGAMTGRGSGYCILKESEPANNQITGYVGLSGRPASPGPGLDQADSINSRCSEPVANRQRPRCMKAKK